MMSTPLRQHTVGAKRIADALRAQIVSGERPPGARIGQEELAQHFDSSRMPVREALRILETEGLVVIESHRGAWVSKLDFEEFRTSYRVRAALEPLALAESIPNLGTAEIDELFEMQQRIVETTQGSVDVDAFLRLDREFHLRTYAGLTFKPLGEMILRMWNTTQHYRRIYVSGLDARQLETTNADHLIIADAVRRGDVESASEAVRIHIRRTARALSSAPERFEPR